MDNNIRICYLSNSKISYVYQNYKIIAKVLKMGKTRKDQYSEDKFDKKRKLAIKKNRKESKNGTPNTEDSYLRNLRF